MNMLVDHMGDNGVKLKCIAVEHLLLLQEIFDRHEKVNSVVKSFEGEYYMVFDTKEIAVEMKLKYL